MHANLNEGIWMETQIACKAQSPMLLADGTMPSYWLSGSWNTFMHLLKQTPPLATGRHFFISELLAPPALCPSSIRRRQEKHMQWAGLGVWLQDLQDWRTCRTEVRHHSVTTARLKGSSRLCSLQPRAGALSFLCSFCMYSKMPFQITEFQWQFRYSIISLSTDSAFLHLLVMYI